MKTFKQLFRLGFIGATISIVLFLFIPHVRVSVIMIAIIPSFFIGVMPAILFAFFSYWFFITFIITSIYYFFIYKESKDSSGGPEPLKNPEPAER
jgi:hypothetical protein